MRGFDRERVAGASSWNREHHDAASLIDQGLGAPFLGTRLVISIISFAGAV